MAAVSESRVDALPVWRTSYVGRCREVTELRTLLGTARLVTVVGPPGVGKTRLAVQMVAERAGKPPDGVAFVGLAELTDAALVANAVGVTLGLRGQAGSEERTLLAALRERRMVLVLDNCEHLIDACARVATAVVRACPQVVVLATSRQPLGVAGEQLFPLSPLAVPDPDSVGSAGELQAYDAVSLLADRMQLILPSFAITEDNYADVARLSQGLDGLPLAIELAAVRVRSLSVRQLSDRLAGRLSLLTGVARTAPQRQRTLRGTVDWSYQLCTPEERLVWARASVFSGSFDLDAAERVCGGDGVEPAAVVDLIGGLVDKSVLAVQEHAGENRYRMLESLREYGREQLSTDESLRARRRHRDCYAARAGRVRAAEGSLDTVALCHQLRPDHPNLRAAIEFCLRTPDEADAGLAMTTDLHLYWQMWRLLAEARTWLDRLLSNASPGGPRRCLALLYSADYCLHEGALQRCAELVAEANGIAARLADGSLMARAELTAGSLAECQGEPRRAAGIFSTAVAGFRKVGNRRGELVALIHHGWSTGFSGDPDGGRALLREGLARSTEYGDLYARLYLLAGLVMIEAEFGAAATAARHLQDLVAATEEAGLDRWDVEWLSSAGWVAGRLGEHARAATLYGITETACRIQGIALHTLAAFETPNARHVQCTREALGVHEFEKHFTAGAAMSEGDALRYAFGVTDTPASAPADPDPLTRRQREIAELVRQGLTNRQIARRLAISLRTAETHVAHITTKLGFTNRAQIAAWAARRQIR
ncbi:ATP-binding protein [Amycolatopsis cihanbeyliensis]|uniref:Non-specific serine/threonine protein kinase n=1 Tax=Amycolatopsis cihanbeyliensis TaxID=1128664 RepID=A0A542DS43_AMYCI|nr:LuxR C-terminal-related transcriptional regulator [Amycolatopsis cihanbeyliensis]TQJ05932.1 non-specific serine/threonine protein kinase [Amycolatopsis cihanbeyliensis]